MIRSISTHVDSTFSLSDHDKNISKKLATLSALEKTLQKGVTEVSMMNTSMKNQLTHVCHSYSRIIPSYSLSFDRFSFLSLFFTNMYT